MRFKKEALVVILLFGAVATVLPLICAADESNTGSATAANAWQIVPSIELGAQVAGENNLFWNLSDVVASDAQFNPDRHWWEFYVKPAVAMTRPFSDTNEFYARLSAVGSGTLKHDAFDAGNTGRLSLEEAVGGVRFSPIRDSEARVDLSLGAQTYTVGTGMLISNGGSNGFDRGALKLGPRKAFEKTAIGRVHSGAMGAEVFYLDPNENPDNDSGTRIVGAQLSYRPTQDRFAGLAYGKVIDSSAPYPQAAPGGTGPPVIIDGARKGLSFLYGFVRWPLLANVHPGLWLGGDFATQRHSRIDLRAWGARFEAGMDWADLPWKPKLKLGFQTFSGDDPQTTRLERFDPLYYEGSPGSWATGSKASMVFINTNVNAFQASIEVRPSTRDIVTAYYAHLRANELRSPLQFGQATRLDFSNGVPTVIAGVTDPHLADDIFLKYTRVVNQNTFVTAGVSASFPGKGIDQLVGGKVPVWTGWFLNIVLLY